MKAELTQEEISKISKEVYLLMSNTEGQKLLLNEFENRIKKNVQTLLDSNFIASEIKFDAVEVIELAVSRALKNSDLIKLCVERKVSEFFGTDEFKKISIQRLKRRIEHLEEEINGEYES